MIVFLTRLGYWKVEFAYLSRAVMKSGRKSVNCFYVPTFATGIKCKLIAWKVSNANECPRFSHCGPKFPLVFIRAAYP